MASLHPLQTLTAHGSMQAMRLNSVSANRHIFAGQANGRPLRLLLNFDGDRTLRLRVAGDGERMIADDGPLDPPFDMGEYGQTDIADVTHSLFPTLRGVEVTDVEALAWQGRRVGVKLNVAGGQPFHFWVDGDELHWGDEASLVSHEWLDGIAPKASERIDV
jgi:hypothetical protein